MLQMYTRYYDDKSGRYLTVDSIDNGSKTVMCVVEELNDAGEYEVTGRQLFNFNELTHFKEV